MLSTFKRCLHHTIYCYLHCLKFSGRDARQIFCDFYLTLCVIGLACAGGVWFLVSKHPDWMKVVFTEGMIFIWPPLLWSMLALLSAATRRGHDLDMSFWKVWFGNRFLGVFFYQYLCREEGSGAPNRFGPAPQENNPHSSTNQFTFPDVWNG